jgi:predicted amino acid-binding ACT domain protein
MEQLLHYVFAMAIGDDIAAQQVDYARLRLRLEQEGQVLAQRK